MKSLGQFSYNQKQYYPYPKKVGYNFASSKPTCLNTIENDTDAVGHIDSDT